VREWLSHQVPGSLCERDPNALLCHGEITADRLSLVKMFVMMLFVWKQWLSGVNEAVESPQMILVEFSEVKHLCGSVHAEGDLCGALEGEVMRKEVTDLEFF